MPQLRHYQVSSRQRLSYLPSCIPVAAVVSLFTLGYLALNPITSYQAYAETVDTITASGTKIAMIIDGDNEIQTSMNATSGQVNYLEHTVQIKAEKIDQYALTLTASEGFASELTSEGSSLVIAGANGETGSALTPGTWGYGWGANNADNSALNYYALPHYGSVNTDLSSGLLEKANTASGSVDFTKKLIFAASFPDDAPAGHYQTKAILSLAAAPKTLTITDITTMQEMTSEICASMPYADTSGNNQFPLKDSRDQQTYKIARLRDGKCWMTQNLALSGGRTLTINDSDLNGSVFTAANSTYTMPASTNGNFSDAMVKDANNVYTYAYHQVRVGYYSWCAATAGTCLSGTYNDVIPSSGSNIGNVSKTTAIPAGQNATSSICPKGWRLPSGGNQSGEFYSLLNGLSKASVMAPPYNFICGGNVSSVGGLTDNGSRGLYWSSTSNSASRAYNLLIESSSVNASDDSNRYWGYNIRCVAR